MTLKEKFFFGAAVVVVAIVAVFSVLSLTKGSGSTPTLGAVGNMLAENYIPFVRVNSGYNSAFPITTSGALTGGALVVTTSNTATSTATFGCWQSYATSTATALSLRFTASTTAPTNGSGVIPVISYGVCP